MKPIIVVVAVAAGALWWGSRIRRAIPMLRRSSPGRISLPVKIGYTAFIAVLVPVYTRHYGIANFLWFSNLALFGGLVAVWLEAALQFANSSTPR